MHNCLINGVTSEFIDVTDRGLSYGDGLFETLLYKDGMCQCWDMHLIRMKAGADKLNIAFPGAPCFLDDVSRLVKSAKSQNLIIKLMLTRGPDDRGYGVKEKSSPNRITSIHPYHAIAELTRGIKAIICKQTVSTNSGLAGIKHLNRLENVIARNEWRDEYHEGIMLDDDNNVIEGTMSNLFIIKENQLFTPDLSRSGVSGIMRQNILNIANKENMSVTVKPLSLDELFDADACFVSNSIIGIWPILSLDCADHVTVNYAQGDISQRLQEKLLRYCYDHAKTIK